MISCSNSRRQGQGGLVHRTPCNCHYKPKGIEWSVVRLNGMLGYLMDGCVKDASHITSQ